MAAGRQQARNKEDNRLMNGLVLTSALLASMALSIVSFYTTWEGVKEFMPNWWMAALATFGVQSLVFYLSWVLAYAIFFNRVRNALGFLLPYLVAAGLSILFSYSSLYGEFSTQRERQQLDLAKARKIASGAVPALATALADDEQQLFSALVSSQDYKDWHNNARQVIQAARSAAGLIEVAMKSQRHEIDSSISNLQSNIERAKTVIQNAEARRKAAEETVANLRNRITEQRKSLTAAELEVSQLNADVTQLQQDLKREETQGGARSPSKPGRGPKWRGIKNQLDDLGPKLYQLQSKFNTRKNLLSEDLERLRLEEQKLTQLRVELKDAELTLTRDGPELDRRNRRARSLFADDSGGVESIASRFNKLVNDFGQPKQISEKTIKALELARETCLDLLNEINKIETLRVRHKNLTCDEAGVQPLLKPLIEKVKAKAKFEEACKPKSGSLQIGKTFEEATAFTRKCINLSELNGSRQLLTFGSVDDLRDRLNAEADLRRGDDTAVERETTPDGILASLASPAKSTFRQARSALEDGASSAYFALSFAIVIDLLVLLIAVAARTMQWQQEKSKSHGVSVWSEMPTFNLDVQPDDAPELAAMKKVLANVSMRRGANETKFDVNAAGLAGDPNVRGLLSLLVIEHEARQEERDGHLLFYISPVGYRMLVERYSQLNAARPHQVRTVGVGFPLRGPGQGTMANQPKPLGPAFSSETTTSSGDTAANPGSNGTAEPLRARPWNPQSKKGVLTED